VSSSHWKNWTSERKSQEKRRRRRRRINCSVYSAFFCESDLLRSLSRGVCSFCLFLGRFDGGFAGASELSEPKSFLCAIGSLASEVEVLSTLQTLVWWLFALWALVLRVSFWCLAKCSDTICWRVPEVSRLLFIKCCRRASLERCLIPLGDGAVNLRRDTSGLGRLGVATLVAGIFLHRAAVQCANSNLHLLS